MCEGRVEPFMVTKRDEIENRYDRKNDCDIDDRVDAVFDRLSLEDVDDQFEMGSNCKKRDDKSNGEKGKVYDGKAWIKRIKETRYQKKKDTNDT